MNTAAAIARLPPLWRQPEESTLDVWRLADLRSTNLRIWKLPSFQESVDEEIKYQRRRDCLLRDDSSLR